MTAENGVKFYEVHCVLWEIKLAANKSALAPQLDSQPADFDALGA